MKRKFYYLFLTMCLLLTLFFGCTNEITENNSEKSAEDLLQETLSDGIINGTNAQTIEDALKSNKEYNFPDDHSLIQSEINDEWHVSSSNNTYNTYTKGYELFAFDSLEVEIASFATYDNDIDYLLFCVSFFDTPYIDIDEIQQWISELNIEEKESSKIFGDAEFILSYGWDNEPTQLKLTITALD